MSNAPDAIVIGAGLGGLAAAATLADAGRRVLVLEYHSVPGGYAHTFRRGKYRFEVSLHMMDGIAPGGWTHAALSALGLLDRLAFERLDPFYVARFPGLELTIPADAAAWQATLCGQFPREAAGIGTMMVEIRQVFEEIRALRAAEGDGRPPTISRMARYPAAARALRTSWAAFLGRHLADPRLKAVMSVLWGIHGLPPSRLNAAGFIVALASFHHHGAWYPKAGSTALARALEANIQAGGGMVRYRQTVKKICVEKGRATGVVTADGARIDARLVVSNANAPDTLLALVGPEHLDDRTLSRLSRSRPSISSVCLYLGLDGEEWTALPRALYVVPDFDAEAGFVAAEQGDFERVPFAVTTRPAPGGATLAMLCLASWGWAEVWGTDGRLEGYAENPRYLALKERVTGILLARLEAALPGVRAAIRHQELSTPLTNARYTRNHHGAIYGFEVSEDGLYRDRPAFRAPLPNLLLAGAWAPPGAGQSAALLSGIDAGREGLVLLGGR